MKYNKFHSKIILILFCSVLFFSYQSILFAQAPMVKTQAPGYFRYMLGDFEITALYDGIITGNSKLLHNAPADEIEKLLKKVYVNPDEVNLSVNAFLVNTGKNLVLIDAGTAKVFGPGLGKVPRNLIASGYKPEQVDVILVTHMHGDHIGGLITDDGNPVYPNAVVYASKAEKDFWYSDAIADKAPVNFKPVFKMVRDLMNPYINTGKFKTVENGELPVAGIKAIDIKGHTAGQLAYKVTSGTQSLLMIGDMLHVFEVQLKLPEVSLDFDADQKKAADVRTEMFKSFAKDGTLIATSHLPFPGIGRLTADGDKGYTWLPVRF